MISEYYNKLYKYGNHTPAQSKVHVSFILHAEVRKNETEKQTAIAQLPPTHTILIILFGLSNTLNGTSSGIKKYNSPHQKKKKKKNNHTAISMKKTKKVMFLIRWLGKKIKILLPNIPGLGMD